MKILISEVRSAIRVLLRESVCPRCGDSEAHIGLHDIECPNPDCKLYNKR